MTYVFHAAARAEHVDHDAGELRNLPQTAASPQITIGFRINLDVRKGANPLYSLTLLRNSRNQIKRRTEPDTQLNVDLKSLLCHQQLR